MLELLRRQRPGVQETLAELAADLAQGVALAGGFHAFEHQWAIGAAFRMHKQMQRPRVAARITAMNDQLKQGLAGLPKVKMHTPRAAALSAGLVAFEIDGVGPNDIVKQLLARRIVASTSPYAVSYARLAPSLVNTPTEVDEALRAVRAHADAADDAGPLGPLDRLAQAGGQRCAASQASA